MKKIKIMLTAIAVVGVVGGALAFKAHKAGGGLFCSTSSGTAGTCNTEYIADSGGSAKYCTTVSGGLCASATTKVSPQQ